MRYMTSGLCFLVNPGILCASRLGTYLVFSHSNLGDTSQMGVQQRLQART